MSESDWNLEAPEEAGMIVELRQPRLKEDIAEEEWKERRYAHEHAFSADMIKARRER